MPDALVVIAAWICLMMGVVGLWRGTTLLLRGERDSASTPGWLVLIEGGALTLSGAALLSGGCWAHLIWLAAILGIIGVGVQIRTWLRRRAAGRG